MREEEAKRAHEARHAAMATLGVDLMNAFNAGKRDPSTMAVTGHDTQTGYEFFVDRDGVTYTVSVTRGWDELCRSARRLVR